MATYEFRAGEAKTAGGNINTPIAGKNAQIVGERLEHIRDTQGRITTRIVLADAKDEESPLHEYFEWRDDVAADRFRQEQARHLIAAVHIVTTDDRDGIAERVITRAFISVDSHDSEEARFEPVAVVLSDAKLYEQACRRALRELRGFIDRYGQFTQLRTIGTKASEDIERELQQYTEAVAAVA